MEIATPLGRDVLLFFRMHAYDELSRVPEYSIDLLSERNDIDLDQILGKMVTVAFELARGAGHRFFNGYVTRFSQGARYGRYHRYHATVRPWLWFLTRTADCRIFQEMTVPDIVKKVFADHGAADFVVELTGSYRQRVYCVQYRETDFNFVSRLLEEEGIYYYFRHTNGHDTMVLTDSMSKHVPAPTCGTLPFISPDRGVRPELEHVNAWDLAREVQPGVFVHDDYDFERPSLDLLTQRSLIRGYTPSTYDVYDYPGNYLEKSDGEVYALARIDELGTQHETFKGSTNARNLSAGALLKLEGQPRADQNAEYLVVSTRCDLQFSSYEGLPSRGPTEYHCGFSAMASKQQFRPRRSAPKPFVQGPQTAVVVGPAGEEIFTDKYARIKVQFHWDRYGKHDENSSCWMRVSTSWAGKTWGAVSLPRIGQEVIVDCLEGDPDQPIVTGCVYNAEQMPPYDLPANKTQSGVKSRSTLKGGPSNYNEIRFEDLKDKEHIVIHAERNLNTTVEVNERRTVGNNSTVAIGGKGDPKKNGLSTTTIYGDTSTTITKGDWSLDVQTGKMTTHVKGVVVENFDDTQTTTVANEIKLVCGASSITMKKDGTIEIKGINIKVNGTLIDSVATAVHTIKGLPVKIN
jgi:type VI secretion system secreted protein VgrG